MQIRIVPGLWFCRRSWRLEVNIRRSSVHFRESHFCAKELDVQETDFSLTQFYRSWNVFSRCRFTHRWNSSSWSWVLVKEVFHSYPNQSDNTKDQVWGNSSRNTTLNKHTQNQTKVPTQHDNLVLSNVDCVPSNAKFSQLGATLKIFEDKEAVIQMIIKGRSPTMRHVSRTHRVALDWLFDRINLNSMIQL